MRALTGWLLGAAALAGMLAVACSGGDEDEQPLSGSAARRATETTEARRTEHAGERATRTALADDTDADGLLDDLDDCPEEAEDTDPAWDDTDGCPDTVEDLLALASDDVETFWAAAFEADGLEYTPAAGFVAYTTELDTACGTTLLGNAFYCSLDHSIYYDLNLIEELLTGKGDFGPAFLVAHEWGHLAQSNLGILDDETLFTIQVELQADCFAGMWAKSADERGILEEGDLEEGIVTLFAFGDPLGTTWFELGAHGTPGQRIDAFRLGYEVGPEACVNPFDDIVPFNPTSTPEPTAEPTSRPPRRTPVPTEEP